MNNICFKLAVMLVAVSLSGCGLKGPLYFPPKDDGGKSQTVTQSQADAQAQQAEPLTPDRNDRGIDSNTPTQVNF